MTPIEPLHLNAVGYTAMRTVKGGVARNYTEVRYPDWAGANHFLRKLIAFGFIKNSSTEPSYAVLDVLDEDCETIQNYDITTAQAFRYIKRMLKLRVAGTDADAAWRATDDARSSSAQR